MVDTLKARAQHGLIEAPGPIRAYLAELTQREALDDFAATVLRDLTIAEHLDEYRLVEDLAALSFGESLLERRPDQAARLATDAVKADRHRPERRAKRKLPQAVDTIFRGLRHQPAGAELTAVMLLGEIVTRALGVDGLDDDDGFGTLRLVRLLDRDERILALLPKRGARQLQRDAAHWIGQAERGDLDLTHPLVFLYRRLDQSARAGAAPTTIAIRQSEVISTFGPASWAFFLAYALGPGDPDLEDTFEIVLTRVEAGTETDGSRSPDLAAGILIEERRAFYLTAEEFRQRHGADLAARSKNATLRLVDAASLVFHGPDE